MTSAIYRVDVVLISIALSFIQVYCSCDGGPTLSCPGQWWNSWYIWVFIGSLVTVVTIVGLRFLCQRYRFCSRCRGRQMMPRRTHEHPSQLDNDQRRYVDGISAYCIPLPPDYNSCSSSPPPYHVIFFDTNKDRRPSPAELQVPHQDLPSYEECVSNKSRTPKPAEDGRPPVEGIDYSGHVAMGVTDGRTLDN